MEREWISPHCPLSISLSLRLMKTFILFTFTLLLLAFLITPELYAQPGLPNSPDQAPIDGRLGILVAVVGAYAIKKLKDRKEK